MFVSSWALGHSGKVLLHRRMNAMYALKCYCIEIDSINDGTGWYITGDWAWSYDTFFFFRMLLCRVAKSPGAAKHVSWLLSRSTLVSRLQIPKPATREFTNTPKGNFEKVGFDECVLFWGTMHRYLYTGSYLRAGMLASVSRLTWWMRWVNLTLNKWWLPVGSGLTWTFTLCE